ncbi:hypothetical protein [Janthinobacterium sp. LB3P118]|uniref:hypothetical protein n=1 Tax=Janthinobacterium sp. LB3P118 TaxID=3424195 RepID=UPI003F24F1EE
MRQRPKTWQYPSDIAIQKDFFHKLEAAGWAMRQELGIAARAGHWERDAIDQYDQGNPSAPPYNAARPARQLNAGLQT